MKICSRKKKEYQRKLKEYETQRARLEDESKRAELKAKDIAIKAFEKREYAISCAIPDHFEKKDPRAGHASAMLNVAKETYQTKDGKQAAPLPAFWLPSLTPSAKETVLEKPDSKTRNPMTGKPLSMKDLITVNFTHVDATSKQAMVSREERYMCPVTRTVIKNSVPCVCLRPSGRVVTLECYTKLIEKDMIDPISGEKLLLADIIQFKTEGTGFSSTSGESLVKKAATAAVLTVG